jgi:hypothetical protein
MYSIKNLITTNQMYSDLFTIKALARLLCFPFLFKYFILFFHLILLLPKFNTHLLLILFDHSTSFRLFLIITNFHISIKNNFNYNNSIYPINFNFKVFSFSLKYFIGSNNYFHKKCHNYRMIEF